MSKTKHNLEEMQITYQELKSIGNEKITTGSLTFDIFLDGGYTPGAYRFYAPSEHGKTAQMLSWAKGWLDHYKEKAEIIIFDAEGRITASKLETSGVPDSPYFSEKTVRIIPHNISDDVYQIILDKVKTNPPFGDPDHKKFFFGIDSLDMLIASADFIKSFSEAEKIGATQVQAALLAKRVGIGLYRRGHHLHILSQVRANINTTNPNSPKTKVSGGNAMLHMANLMGEILKDWNEMYIYENPKATTKAAKGLVIGKYHTIKMLKTPNEKTHHVIRIPIKYGVGIWWEREISDLVLAYELVTVKGSWHYLNEEWIDRINTEVNIAKRNEYVKEHQKLTLKEAKEKGEKISAKKAKELTIQFKAEAEEKIPLFEVEPKWHGYDNFFAYLENNPDVCSWMDKELRTVLLGQAIGERVEEESVFE